MRRKGLTASLQPSLGGIRPPLVRPLVGLWLAGPGLRLAFVRTLAGHRPPDVMVYHLLKPITIPMPARQRASQPTNQPASQPTQPATTGPATTSQPPATRTRGLGMFLIEQAAERRGSWRGSFLSPKLSLVFRRE